MSRVSATRFAAFLHQHGITCVRIAVRAGISPGYGSDLKQGKSEPTLGIMVALAGAASLLLRRKVRVTELFDLGDGER